MKTYQITYEDGSVSTYKATDFGDLVQGQIIKGHRYFDIEKIERIDRAEIAKRVAKFNEIISLTFRSKYYSKTVGTQLIIDCLNNHEFNFRVVFDMDFPGDTGGHRNVEVGPGVYLTLMWHKMESGNFEFVCYLS